MTATLLNKVIKTLGFENGDLHDASDNPINLTGDDWLNKSDWLISANEAKADKVLFIDNNPVVVFAHCDTKNEIKEKFNRIWCLSRPRILFLESPGEISVIDLAQAPIEPDKDVHTLNILKRTSDRLEELQNFNYENIKSGRAFNEKFDDLNTSNRADFALINDLRIVKAELLHDGLDYSPVHKLITRSIFIRYLEDRNILTYDYYKTIAKESDRWQNLLDNTSSEELFDFSNTNSLYARVLQSKSFTYALFEKLMSDFNGDMFYDIDTERGEVTDNHLNKLRGLLFGDVGIQRKLFFYSYKFNIIPLSLISSICEEFYHNEPISENERKNNAKKTGAFYTPPVLVEFLLSRILTTNVLKTKPRILDPACGSGIFLVEAFRRIVRLYVKEEKKLNFTGLKEIIKKQISGIEINEDAARITAFSLNLALLNYLDPPSIIEQIKKKNRLPNLIDFGNPPDNQHFNIIHKNNAFDLDISKLGKFDVIIGNPPWGELNVKNHAQMQKWLNNNNYNIADKESSQAFLFFALHLLKSGGQCSMLVSSGVLFNPRTEIFRRCFFPEICLKEIFNFIHIRKHTFFNARSPFILIHFSKESQNNFIDYWSIKRSGMLAKTQAIIFTKYDKAFLRKQDILDNRTWKINWFGRHADVRFNHSLEHLPKITTVVNRKMSGQGYIPGKNKNRKISNMKTLNFKKVGRYSNLSFIDTPMGFYRFGKFDAYFGKRILINRGILEKGYDKGIIISRYEKKDFCFPSTVGVIKLINDRDDFYFLFLGIFLSSFARYYFFNTSAGWGLWHDEIRFNELLQLPIPDDINEKKAKKIISIVKELRKLKDVFSQENKKLEKTLDKAVFDLYEFSNLEITLINDFCRVTLPFFYDPYNSLGCKLVIEKGSTKWITDYAKCFSEYWQPYLADDEALRADLCVAVSNNIIAIEFYIADFVDDWDLTPQEKLWRNILSKIEEKLTVPFGSLNIFVDGIVQVDLDKSIIIIKRNEKRFWTKSLAYEDAESIMAKRIIESNTKTGSSK